MGPAGMPGGEGGKEGFILRAISNPKVAERIGLSDEQAARIKRQITDHKRQEIKLRAEHELAALEQASLLTGKEVDEAAVMAAVEKAGKARTEIAKLRVKAILMLKETLTDEQREQVHKMMAERFRGRRKERREGMERFRAAGRGRRRDPGDGPAEAGPDGDAPPGD